MMRHEMNRIKNLLSQSNFVLITLILLGMRAIADANPSQAAIVVAFASLHGYMSYLKSLEQKDLNAEVKEELANIRNHITGLTIKNTARQQPAAADGRRFF